MNWNLKIAFTGFYLFLISSVFAQQDSTKNQKKNIGLWNVHDTASPNYNKGKLNFNLETGFSNINQIGPLGGSALSSAYDETFSPLVNFSVSYGIGEKSNLGISTTFQVVNFNPIKPAQGLTSGNISVFIVGIRYTHCIKTWKLFYYGMQLGSNIWSTEINPNTFDRPLSYRYDWVDINFIFGSKFNITKNISLHIELVFYTIDYLDFGITYRIDPKKNQKKNHQNKN